jgi:hypothetical protein
MTLRYPRTVSLDRHATAHAQFEPERKRRGVASTITTAYRVITPPKSLQGLSGVIATVTLGLVVSWWSTVDQ